MEESRWFDISRIRCNPSVWVCDLLVQCTSSCGNLCKFSPQITLWTLVTFFTLWTLWIQGSVTCLVCCYRPGRKWQTCIYCRQESVTVVTGKVCRSSSLPRLLCISTVLLHYSTSYSQSLSHLVHLTRIWSPSKSFSRSVDQIQRRKHANPGAFPATCLGPASDAFVIKLRSVCDACVQSDSRWFSLLNTVPICDVRSRQRQLAGLLRKIWDLAE